MAWTTPPVWTSGQVVTATDMNKYVSDNVQYLYDNMQNSVALFPPQAVCTVGSSSIAINANTAQLLAAYWKMGSAQNDAYTWSFVARAGATITISAYGALTNDAGIVQWDVDGASVGSTQDWYAGSTTANTVKTIAGVTLGYNGYHTIAVTATSKNGSSSSYKIPLSMVILTPLTV